MTSKRKRKKSIAAIWKDRNGSVTPLTAWLILAVLLMICGIAEFARLSVIAGGVKDGLQQAVISVAVTNYDEVYAGLREGYSGGYQLNGNRWEETLDYDDVYARLEALLGTRRIDNRHVKEQGAGYEYRLSDLRLEIEHPSLAPGNAEDNFKADAWITIEIPLSFGWEMLPPLQMELHAQAAYLPKF